MRSAAAGVLLVAVLLTGCTTPKSVARVTNSPYPDPTDFSHGPADPSAGGDAQVEVSVLARGLNVPWGVTFLPDGAGIVTERGTGRILKIGPDRDPTGDLTVTQVARLTESTADNEGGLLGIAASPDYKRDKTLYIYYTTDDDNRIAKLVLGQKPRPIVTGIPKSGIHNGGRLAFGPDGYLYASTGEASHTDSAQNLASLGGKILRMTTDGKPPPGNPFKNSLVYSYGHRNPEGLAWDANGRMYSSEIGEAVWDELNLIQPGRNYGWPAVEGIGGKEKYTDPIAAWRPEIGVSAGVAILGSTAVITCLRGQRIYLVPLDHTITADINSPVVAGGPAATAQIRWRPAAGVAGKPVEALTTKYGRLRTAINAPDGSLWITTSNRDGRRPGGPTRDDDRVLRLTFRTR
ncbi:PQQ-dependent sugar dehydrogenase [Dactylosporangium sp. NPDC005572]|uniref:PQQ-dependent sugar dehydrogenase n=1 Tax=Dactylosporangium sp. NPDC005572 TaxID=3156889 RepID=UPI0033B5E5D4